MVEPVRVTCVGCVQDDGACSPDPLGLAGMHDVGRQKSKAGVTMMIVVRSVQGNLHRHPDKRAPGHGRARIAVNECVALGSKISSADP